MQALSSLFIILCGISCIRAALLPHHKPRFAPNVGIHGGGVASPHEYPPTVWIQTFAKNTTDKTLIAYQCGGSLISKDYVLTAAHCLETNLVKRKHEIVLGVHDFDTDDTSIYQIFEVTKANFISHSSYSPRHSYFADIGLIKLPSSARIQKGVVELATLPKRADVSKTYVNDNCKAYGWGITTNKGNVSEVLRYYQSKVISSTECTKRTREDNSDKLCTDGKDAANENVGICGGDSGGPLIDPNRVLIGVISTSPQCEEGGTSRFTKVATYLDWIANNSNAVVN